MQNNTDRYIEVAQDVHLYVQDYGQGQPVLLIHGWPLSHEMWEYQVEALVNSNFRVITYDRRGFGKSSKPWSGYDYDTLADDLKAVIDELDLDDITLVGYSMGGGEVVRYFSRHDGKGVIKAVLLSSITPFLIQTADNPDGVSRDVFIEMAEQIRKDRIGFLDSFGKTFFGFTLLSKPLSAPLLEYYRSLAACASPRATLECLNSFSQTDFRSELASLNVPVLLIHGDADKTVPIDVSAEESMHLLSDYQYIVYAGASHGLFYTERDQLNQDLIEFLKIDITSDIMI